MAGCRRATACRGCATWPRRCGSTIPPWRARLRRGASAASMQGRQRHLCARPCPALPLRAGTSAEMTMNMPPEPPAGRARLRESAAALLGGTDPYQLLRYWDFGGTPSDRAAVSGWLRRLVRPPAATRRWSARASTAPWWRCCRKWRAAGRRYASRRWPIRASRPSLPSLAFTCRRCRATKTACWGRPSKPSARRSGQRCCIATRPCRTRARAPCPRRAREILPISRCATTCRSSRTMPTACCRGASPMPSLRWRRN